MTSEERDRTHDKSGGSFLDGNSFDKRLFYPFILPSFPDGRMRREMDGGVEGDRWGIRFIGRWGD